MFTRILFGAVVLAGGGAWLEAGDAPALPQRDTYLLLDARVVARAENAVLRIGPVRKHPADPLFRTAEFPFEEYTDNLYPNVLCDAEEGVYKCWYFSVLEGWGHNYRNGLAPGELAVHLRDALDWIQANPDAAEAKTTLRYAWNKMDEGGWLVPDKCLGTAKLDEIRSVLDEPSRP